MKHVILHFISFLLGIAVAGAGFTYFFPQVDPQQEQESSKNPPSHNAQHQDGDGNPQFHQQQGFSPKDRQPPNAKGTPKR